MKGNIFKIFIAVGFSFLFGGLALACDVIAINTETCNFSGASSLTNANGQTFTATHNNISGMWFHVTQEDTTFEFYICKGTPSIGDFNTSYNCTASGNTLIYHSSAVNGSNTGQSFLYFTPVALTIGDAYYFSVKTLTGANTLGYTQSTCYSGGYSFTQAGSGYPTDDFMFKTYYDDNYNPAPTFQINFIKPALDGSSIYYTMPDYINFSYENPLNWYPTIKFMVRRQATTGNTAWPDFIPASIFTTSKLASTTVITASSTFQLPDGIYDIRADFAGRTPEWIEVATTTFMIATGGDYGGYSFSTTTPGTCFDNIPLWSVEDLCGTATTTIRCMIKESFSSLGQTLFSPSCDAIANFKTSYSLFKQSFPFNAFFELTGTITSVASSTTATTSGTLKIPFINTGGDYYMLDAVSSSTLSNWIGASNYNLFRTTIGYFFWLVAVAIVFFTIKFI
jgi:hypothetical protein